MYRFVFKAFIHISFCRPQYSELVNRRFTSNVKGLMVDGVLSGLIAPTEVEITTNFDSMVQGSRIPAYKQTIKIMIEQSESVLTIK